MCDTGKVVEQKPDELAVDKLTEVTEYWECSLCTLHNHVGELLCSACSTPNPNVKSQHIPVLPTDTLHCDVHKCKSLQNIAHLLKQYQYIEIQSMEHNKEVKLLKKLFENVLKNPNEKKFKDLNLSRLRAKLGKCEILIDQLYNAGFYKSNNGKRLFIILASLRS
eukprot:UN13531